jgi:hypothetical protein
MAVGVTRLRTLLLELCSGCDTAMIVSRNEIDL